MKGLTVTATLLAALLGGCGMSNQTLKAEHDHQRVHLNPEDDTVTLIRLTEDVVVATEYNLRYTLTATALAGEYVASGRDRSDGTYFSRRTNPGILMKYTGATVVGRPTEDFLDGGVHLDAKGAASLYWFWDTVAVDVVRLPVPGLVFVATTEIDQAKRQARLEREARERQAKLDAEARERQAKLDAEERERKEASERERRARQMADLVAAKARNKVRCLGIAQCDRVFAQAQAYVLQQSDMRIQVATNTLIETYNSTEAGKISMRIVRLPTSGDAWEVQMTAACNEGESPTRYGDLCERLLLSIYSGFFPHMQAVR